MNAIFITVLILFVLLIIGVLQIIYPQKMMLFSIRWAFRGKEDIGQSMVLITRIQGVIIVVISVFSLINLIN